ncbi:IMPACT family protein [Chryseobacterium sp. A301]
MITEFKTAASKVENILTKEKGSKFIGFLYPISTEEEFQKALIDIKAAHPKATHHCYAFRLGLEGENYRANDDGEPSGSAGLPIYNQLLSNELTNVLLVVVRYYGGTKLGVSGLVKAYKESAILTLEECKIITQELESLVRVTFPFASQNVIFTVLNKLQAKVLQFDADQSCQITARIKTSQKDDISNQFAEMPSVQFEIEEIL